MPKAKTVICISNVNEYDGSTFPLIVGKTYKVYQEDNGQFWVEDCNGIIEHYDRELFKIKDYA